MDSQELLKILIPSIVSFLIGLAPSIFPKLINRKYAPIVSAALKALSPVLADNTKSYGKYGVNKIVEAAIASIDKSLTQPEITKVAELTRKKFDPAIAASKLDNPVSQAVCQAIASTEGDISKLDLSRIRWNFTISRD